MKRIATAAVLIPLFVWIIVFAPFDIFRIALMIVGIMAYWEFYALASPGELRWAARRSKPFPESLAGSRYCMRRNPD